MARSTPEAKGKTLKAILGTKVVPDSISYADTFSSYRVLDTSSFKHYRINHAKLFSDQKTTSTVSRTSETRPSLICVVATVFRRPTRTSSCRSARGVSIHLNQNANKLSGFNGLQLISSSYLGQPLKLSTRPNLLRSAGSSKSSRYLRAQECCKSLS